ADLKHALVLKEILDRFCNFSRYRVNARKTIIFFSRGVNNDPSAKLTSLLGFQKVHNLGTYLGMSLFHNRVTYSTLRFVVEKRKEDAQSYGKPLLRYGLYYAKTYVDLLHVLRDYLAAREVWLSIVPTNLQRGDVQAKWGIILGYNHYLGIYSVFDAELWEILDGLTLIRRRGYNIVFIHTNSLEVVKALQDIYLVELSLALMALERSTDVQVFDDILEELVVVLRA
ncbi:hypothetical protein Golax_021863, partial [Gossypium laxum]|nr:hypothetical protein [Gossypium laxum]